MEMYISDGSLTIQLPVLPSEFSIQTSHHLEEVNIQELGDVILIGKRKLDSVTISSIFPAQEYPFMHGKFRKPYDICADIRRWEDNGAVLQLQITGAQYGTSVVIESFSYGESDGTGDVSFSIVFKEYRQLSTARVTKNMKQQTYVCQKGDTFYSIARMFTGNSANAEAIARMNGMKVSARLKKGKRIIVSYEG